MREGLLHCPRLKASARARFTDTTPLYSSSNDQGDQSGTKYRSLFWTKTSEIRIAKTVGKPIDPAVTSSAHLPGVERRAGFLDMVDLIQRVSLAESIFFACVQPSILSLAPVKRFARGEASGSRAQFLMSNAAHAAAAVVPHNHDVLYLQDAHGVLNDEQQLNPCDDDIDTFRERTTPVRADLVGSALSEPYDPVLGVWTSVRFLEDQAPRRHLLAISGWIRKIWRSS